MNDTGGESRCTGWFVVSESGPPDDVTQQPLAVERSRGHVRGGGDEKSG